MGLLKEGISTFHQPRAATRRGSMADRRRKDHRRRDKEDWKDGHRILDPSLSRLSLVDQKQIYFPTMQLEIMSLELFWDR